MQISVLVALEARIIYAILIATKYHGQLQLCFACLYLEDSTLTCTVASAEILLMKQCSIP